MYQRRKFLQWMTNTLLVRMKTEKIQTYGACVPRRDHPNGMRLGEAQGRCRRSCVMV